MFKIKLNIFFLFFNAHNLSKYVPRFTLAWNAAHYLVCICVVFESLESTANKSYIQHIIHFQFICFCHDHDDENGFDSNEKQNIRHEKKTHVVMKLNEFHKLCSYTSLIDIFVALLLISRFV